MTPAESWCFKHSQPAPGHGDNDGAGSDHGHRILGDSDAHLHEGGLQRLHIGTRSGPRLVLVSSAARSDLLGAKVKQKQNHGWGSQVGLPDGGRAPVEVCVRRIFVAH